MQTRDELIYELESTLLKDINVIPYATRKANDFYDRIAARAVHDHMLALLGPGKGECEECRVEYEWNGADGIRRCMCPLVNPNSGEPFPMSEQTRAQCPKVKE